MRTLGPRGGFWTAAAVAALALWTSAAPTVSYPLYAAEWHLSPTATTTVFAVYPVTLVVVLVLFGDLSDHIGRRPAILLGLVAMLAGVLLFAVAPGVGWLFVGRAFMGIGVGLSLARLDRHGRAEPARGGGPGGRDHDGGHGDRSRPGHAGRRRAGAVRAVPLHLDFVVLAVLVAGVLVLAWFLPRTTPGQYARRWRPRGLVVPRGLRGIFVAAALAVTAAYALGAVVLALGAQIARQLVGSSNALVTGAVLAVSAVVIGAVRDLFPPVAARVLIGGGAAGSAVGLALFAWAAATHSLPLFLAASALSGAGYSLNFLGGLTLVNRHAPTRHRAGLLSAVLGVAYLLQGVAALLLGAVATTAGLQAALDLGAPVIAAIGLAALVAVLVTGRVRAVPAPVA